MSDNTAQKITLESFLSAEPVESFIASISFEEGVKILEQLCSRLETGELPLQSSVDFYEKGVLLSQKLEKELNQAEEKIKIISKKGTIESTDI
jgi:exodeoxyribonuclease VII small subunit